MKKQITIIILVLAGLNFTGYAQENQDPSVVEPVYIFSGSQSFQGVADGGSPRFLNLTHDIFAGVEFPSDPYTLGLWLEEAFTLDFGRLQEDIALNKMINNSFTVGIDNTFFYKNSLYVNANFYASFVLPYNQYKIIDFTPIDDDPYLLLTPLLKVGGMYYFGLDWEIEQDFPVKFIFAANSSSFKPTTILSLSYEFFRNSGPRNFTVAIKAGDSLTFSIPLQNLFRGGGEGDEEDDEEDGGSSTVSTVLPNTLLNSLNLGLVFNIYSWSVSLGVLNNITYGMGGGGISANEIGFSAGLSYDADPFTFSGGYTGYMRYADDAPLWVSVFSVGWTIDLDSLGQAAKK